MRTIVQWRALFGAILLMALLLPAWPAAAAPARQDGVVHVVQRGETLSEIARRYGISSVALAQANDIQNANFIYAGQRLAVPGALGVYTGTAAASDGMHTVSPGENLSTIAATYGISLAALAQANGVTNPNHIYVGQRLVIANAGYSASPAAVSVAAAPVAPAAAAGGQRWIDIDLGAQTLTAYEGYVPVFNTLVSTGLTFPTPVGTYSILYKVRSQRMTGPDYDLPNVPWIMYFTNRGHAIHGAYWHNSFGQPMSHGCVNVRPDEAQWLYEFAPTGTQIVVHE